MNYIIWGFAALSFAISCFLGKWLKSYWALIAVLFVGIIVSVPSFLLYMRFANVIEKTGLAVIAVMPVLIIMISFFNITASFLGGLLGVFLAKRKNKKSVSSV